MKRLSFFTLLSFLCAFILLQSSALFAASTKSPGAGKVQTNIKSARMDYNADGQIVVFSGKVYVTRPDFELWADKITVYLEKKGNAPKETMSGMQAGEIDRIIAEKNVIIKSDAKEAHAQKATYTVKNDEFKLEGSPWLKDKENTIRGNTIYHYLNANKSVVAGGAEASFSAPDTTTKK